MTQLGLNTAQLYEEDYLLWLEETVKQLKNRNLEKLDWVHLIEELEALGNEQKHKVDSYLLQILIHLLLYKYWISEKERCQRGWRDEIDNFRVQLEVLFESKRLYNYFTQRIEVIYPKAKRRAITKTELSSYTFPEQCPFTLEQIMDAQFFPED